MTPIVAAVSAMVTLRLRVRMRQSSFVAGMHLFYPLSRSKRASSCPAHRLRRVRAWTTTTSPAAPGAVIALQERTIALMADQEDVRRIALSLPETAESDTGFAFSVRNKGKD